jgi:HNH endonuclease
LRGKIDAYCESYKDNYPILNKFHKTMREIPDEEFFLILPNSTSGNAETILLYNYLHARNSNSNEEDVLNCCNAANSEHFGIFGSLLENYHITTEATEKRTYIGEPDKSKRICRFCNRGIVDNATFKNVAHTIPEALGNKALILHEECDACNAKFGKSIEQDFINYFNFYRVFWSSPGKNGVPRIKFKNGYIERREGKFIVGYRSDPIKDERTLPTEVTLVSCEKIATVNIYKALCKIALSVIDRNELKHLSDTINWLHSTDVGGQVRLPKVAILNAPQMHVKCPQIILYLRQSDQQNLPHLVGEFKFKSLLFVFIVPFSDLDTKKFVNNEEYQTFWESFPHYDAVSGWRFEHFDSRSKGRYSFTLKPNNRTVFNPL